MDQHWGDDDWHHDGDADTTDLSGPDTPLSGTFDEHLHGDGDGAGFDGHPGADQPDAGDLGDQHADGAGSGGGYLEDDPMGAFGHDPGDPGHNPGDTGHGSGDAGHDSQDHDPDGEIAPLDAGLHDAPDSGDLPGEHDTDPPADHDDQPGYDDPAEVLHSTETTVGADPDVDHSADWAPADFPEQLDVNPPEPVDGYPWSDATAVAGPGTAETTDPATGPSGAPAPQELLEYAGADGNGGDPWNALLGSDDPATSSLGRWWAPS
jgi:hypothetical protein